MNLDYLVYIKAKTCPACISFNPIWNEVKDNLPKLNIITIESPTTDFIYDTKKYPLGFGRYVKHFPFLMIFKNQEWNSALKEKREITNPIIIDISRDKNILINNISKAISNKSYQPQIKVNPPPQKVECISNMNIVPYFFK